MSEAPMALGEFKLQRILSHVRGPLHGWLNDMAPQVIVGPRLLERTVRVGDELKSLRGTMATRFEADDERFKVQHAAMNAVFGAVDKRLAAVGRRFEVQQATLKAQLWIAVVGFAILRTLRLHGGRCAFDQC